MPKSAIAVFSIAAVCAVCLPAGTGRAADRDCNSPLLTPTEATICGDRELSQAQGRVDKRVRDLQRRQGYGLYLGLRYWLNRSSEARDACGIERACLAASYRSQQRVLERLQVCLDNSIRRRSCLRVVIQSEETATARGGAPSRFRP